MSRHEAASEAEHSVSAAAPAVDLMTQQGIDSRLMSVVDEARKSNDLEQSFMCIMRGIAGHKHDDVMRAAPMLYAALVHGTTAQGVMPAQ